MRTNGATKRRDPLVMPSKGSCALVMAGVDPFSLHTGRCLLIDPPRMALDSLAEWALYAVDSVVEPQAITNY